MIIDDPQRFSGATTSMQRQRILPGGTIAQSVFGGERSQLSGYLSVPPLRKVDLPSLLERLQSVDPKLLDFRKRPIEVFQFSEWLASPKPHRFIEQSSSGLRVFGISCLPRLFAQQVESKVLDLFRRNRESVSVRFGLDPVLGDFWKPRSKAGQVRPDGWRRGVPNRRT